MLIGNCKDDDDDDVAPGVLITCTRTPVENKSFRSKSPEYTKRQFSFKRNVKRKQIVHDYFGLQNIEM